MEEMYLLPALCIRLGLAVVLAGALGIERERKNRGAGLRTHILVCLGATMTVSVADLFAEQWLGSGTSVIMDKGRIAAGVITGIGFLGAGTIVTVGAERRGLTTAAMIWFVACLGITIGMGYYFLSMIATAFALLAVLGLECIESMLPGGKVYTVAIRIPKGLRKLGEVEELFKERGCEVKTSRLQVKGEEAHVDMTFKITVRKGVEVDELVERLYTRFPSAEKIVLER